jgi:hypothetical protein
MGGRNSKFLPKPKPPPKPPPKPKPKPKPAPKPVWRNPYPDKQGEINQKNYQIAALTGTFAAENANANVVQTNINKTVDTKKGYFASTAGYKADEPIKQGDLHEVEGKVLNLNNDIDAATININDTNKSVEITKGGNLVTIYANADASKAIADKMKDTTEQSKNIYTGMNRTNHSLMNTIKNTQNSQTTDRSRVTYQIQQTEYFSTLNNILLIVYILLLLLFAFLLYRSPINMSMFMKMVTFILLILLPYVSLIYYQYIV